LSTNCGCSEKVFQAGCPARGIVFSELLFPGGYFNTGFVSPALFAGNALPANLENHLHPRFKRFSYFFRRGKINMECAMIAFILVVTTIVWVGSKIEEMRKKQ